VDITLWTEIVLFIILMLFSGFFSSSETSLFSLSKLRLEKMRHDDDSISLLRHGSSRKSGCTGRITDKL